MTNERNALKAGIFILVSMALVIALIVGIKGVGRLNDPSDDRKVTFNLADNVSGLRVGDDVRVGGLKVGVVRDVELIDPEAERPRVVVTFTFPRRVPLHQDAAIVIESNVTGAADLNVADLGRGPVAAAGEAIPGTPGASISSLLASVSEVVPHVKSIVASVDKTTVPAVNDAVGKFARTADTFTDTGHTATDFIKAVRAKFEPLLDTGKQAMAAIGDFFASTTTDFRQTIANMRTSTDTINGRLPSIMGKVDDGLGDVRKAITGANDALTDIKKIAANTRDITATGRSVLVENRSRIDAMILAMKSTADNLKGASTEIRHSPWRLLYQPKPGELANLTLYDSARQFSDGANKMADAAGALQDALKDPNADQDKVRELYERLETSFNAFNKVEAELWKQVKD